MFTVKELLRFWGLLKPTPESQHNWVMERDLEKLIEHVKRHFPEAYATSCTTPYGTVWGVCQSPKHHTFGLPETELEAWQESTVRHPATPQVKCVT